MQMPKNGRNESGSRIAFRPISSYQFSLSSPMSTPAAGWYTTSLGLLYVRTLRLMRIIYIK
jgi:hypothetical protein